MVEKAATAADTSALLEDDVAVPPSNNPDAVAETVRFTDMRILVAAMVGGQGGGYQLVTTAQETADGPFPPAGGGIPVNGVAYEAVLAGASAKDGRIALAAVRAGDKGVDLILQHAGESASGPTHPATAGAEWEKPLDLGSPADTVFAALQVGLDAQGRIAVFGVSGTGDVWWIYKNPPKVVMTTVTITPPGTTEPITIEVPEQRPADPPFSDWQKLDGARVAKLVLANNADGRIVLFAITTSAGGGDVVFNEPRVMNASHPTDWYGWEPVAADSLAPFTDIGASLDDNDAVNVFALDAQHEISHARQVKAGGRNWTSYAHPGLTLAGLDCMAAGLDASGNVALAGATGEGVVWTNLERAGRIGVWSGWQPSAHAPAATALEFEFNANGSLGLFGLTPPGNGGIIWMLAQAAPGSTEWGARSTPVLTGASAMTVVRDLRIAAG